MRQYKIKIKKGQVSDVVYIHDNGSLEWEDSSLLTSGPVTAEQLAMTHTAMEHGADFLKKSGCDSYEVETVTE